MTSTRARSSGGVATGRMRQFSAEDGRPSVKPPVPGGHTAQLSPQAGAAACTRIPGNSVSSEEDSRGCRQILLDLFGQHGLDAQQLVADGGWEYVWPGPRFHRGRRLVRLTCLPSEGKGKRQQANNSVRPVAEIRGRDPSMPCFCSLLQELCRRRAASKIPMAERDVGFTKAWIKRTFPHRPQDHSTQSDDHWWSWRPCNCVKG